MFSAEYRSNNSHDSRFDQIISNFLTSTVFFSLNDLVEQLSKLPIMSRKTIIKETRQGDEVVSIWSIDHDRTLGTIILRLLGSN